MASRPTRSGALVTARDEHLADTLCRWIGGGLGLTATGGLILVGLGDAEVLPMALMLGAIGNSALMYRTGQLGRGAQRIATFLGVYGALAAAMLALVRGGVVTLAVPPLLLVVAALVHSARTTNALTALLILLHVGAATARGVLTGSRIADMGLLVLVPPAILLLIGATVRLLLDRHEARRSELHLRLLEIEAVLPAVQDLARGDLSQEVFGEGPLADATRRTQRELSSLARELGANVAVLRSVAGVVDRTAVNQAKQIVQLADSANELHAAQEQLVGQARKVANAAAAVAEAADESKRASSENEARLEALAQTAQKVAEHHLAIRQIATKSEVLAVNAAIEAVHAGEAGRAFASVAARLQALAEAVRAQLATAEALNEELLRDAKASQAAATRATSSTGRSAASAQQIADTAEDQRTETERFARTLAEIEDFAELVRRDSDEGRGHAKRLVEVATQLAGEVARFKTSSETNPPTGEP